MISLNDTNEFRIITIIDFIFYMRAYAAKIKTILNEPLNCE